MAIIGTGGFSSAASLSTILHQTYDQSFLLAQEQNQVLDQYATVVREINSKAINIPKFSGYAPVSTSLAENDNMVGSGTITAAQEITITPLEFGNTTLVTKLLDLQTGGQGSRAIVQLMGQNMGRSMDTRALAQLYQSTNAFVAGNQAAAAVTVSNGTANIAYLNYAYNKLARHSIPKFDQDAYVMVAHDDVIADLRADATPGSFTDVTKYSMPDQILKGEVGMFRGFRIVRQNDSLITAGTTGTPGTLGNTVDIYNSVFLGYNGLGRAESLEPSLVFAGPFDPLGRLVNVGWYGVFDYSIVDQDAVWVGQSTSFYQGQGPVSLT
jgi:N4-gp56 family major capsid protein